MSALFADLSVLLFGAAAIIAMLWILWRFLIDAHKRPH